jgi:membrane protein
MMQPLRQGYDRLMSELWEKEISQRGRLGRYAVFMSRLLYGVGRKFGDGQLTLRAMSLVYTTLLSLVPLLAVSFSVLKAFGIHDQLEPFLMDFLAPLGAQGEAVVGRILEFVGNIEVGVLGSVGIAFLFYTVISLVQKVEEAFNEIWRVPNTRSFGRRFSDYLSVILIGPVLIFSAVGLATAVMSSAVVQELSSIEPFGTLILWVGRLLSYVPVCGAFAFIYSFIPNTRVRLNAALAGGVFTGVLWFSSGWVFAAFVAGSTNYPAVYSGFASAILFMIWLYVGWLIILVGAQVTFYWQNPHIISAEGEKVRLDNRQRERLALAIMTLIGHSHYYNEPLWTKGALAARLGLRPDVLVELLKSLEARKLIVANQSTPPAYLPARDIETIGLDEVIGAVRGMYGEPPKTRTGLPAVKALMEQVDEAIVHALHGRTVKSLVLGEQDQGEPQRSMPVSSGKSVPYG